MTFIASVVAKKGVAIIADSLVTTSKHVIEQDTFVDFLRSKVPPGSGSLANISIQADELVQLFDKKTSHTKDYEEKLFKFDNYTAVTTAGVASINDKRIEDLIKEIIGRIPIDIPFDDKVNSFCKILNEEAIAHLKSSHNIGTTIFIITHYDVEHSKTVIFKVQVTPSSAASMTDESTFNCVEQEDMENYRVVCEGQNRISERILWGEMEFFYEVTPKIVDRVIADLNIQPDQLPPDYVVDFIKNSREDILSAQFYEDLKITKLAGLSLQQAVDLAGLLMTIEINFQKYTQNIPTVGGVIKLAVIDRDGFKWISGNDILKPETIH